MKSDDLEVEPPQSRIAGLAGALEKTFRTAALLGTRLLVLTVGLFAGYLLVGSVLLLVGSPVTPGNFASLEDDHVFYNFLTVIGLLLVQSSGSFLLYEFVTGFESQRDRLAVLFGFIALGFGGGILRITLSQSLEFVLSCCIWV